jgi:CHAD domain-containing protein
MLDAELAGALPRVLASSDDEAIHDLRVAVRRLRTLLKLARPIFGRYHADAVRAAFTVIHRATGTLRDAEVLGETLDAIASDSPAVVAWKMRRSARERSLRRNVIARLRAGDLSRARKLLSALVTLPVVPKRDRPAHDGVALHDLRIAYKELRYSVELLSEALPADLVAMAEPASRFQKRLGEIHDADMALVSLRRARGLDPATRASLLAELEALRAKRVAKYVADMTPRAEEPEAATTSASIRSGRSRAS